MKMKKMKMYTLYDSLLCQALLTQIHSVLTLPVVLNRRSNTAEVSIVSFTTADEPGINYSH